MAGNSDRSFSGTFDGSIESADPSSPTTRCGGFVGYNNSSITMTITDCLLAADMSTISGTGSCTFVRPYNGYTINNSYYITAFGNTLQGTQVYSISKGDDYVTTLENAGTVSNNYTTSDLTFYNVGLKYGNVLYAPANNYVSLTLDHVNRESDGYFFDQYTVSAGTLTGTDNPYTLFMTNSVTISANYNNSSGGCLRPTNLSASNITDSAAMLVWTSDVENYEMAYALNSGTAWTLVTGITDNQYTLTGLKPQTTYKVRVRANCDNNATSAWSDIIIFTTQPGETPPESTNHPSIDNLQGKPQRFRIFRGLEVNGKQQPANWTSSSYWSSNSCPSDNDTVVIASGTICKVTNMEEIHYKKLYIIDDDSEMREQDQRAGQLLLPKGANVEATLIKRIRSWHEHSAFFTQHEYGNIISGYGNWYLISFPTHVEELEDPNYLPDFEGAGMITSELTYDLFFFQQAWWDPMMNDYYNLFDGGPADPTNPEAADGYKGCWRNYRYYLPGTHSFYDETEDATYWYTLNDFKADHNAYLYAATNADDVVFGTNLLGNPYPCNARITVVFFLSNRASDWQGDGPLVTFKPYDPEAQGNTSQIDYIRGENLNLNLNQLCIEVHEANTLTFNSSDCNYATRFKIVFEEQATNDIVDNFAYVSNGNDTKTQKIVIE